MEQQQLETMLLLEQSFYPKRSMKSHPKRRLIADCLNKLADEERVSEDIFALTMNIFDRYIVRTSSNLTDDRSSQLTALVCYQIAKKLRTNMLINNENEKLSLIFSAENYSDEEIFDTEELICNTLDWDLAYHVPHDYIQLIFKHLLSVDDRTQIRVHVHILLSIAICELNTLSIVPSLLACACLKAAMKGLSLPNIHQIDDFIVKNVQCQKIELIHTQHVIEQFFQSCLQNITPSPRRPCLAPLETSPQQYTRVK